MFEDFTVGDVYEHPLGRTILDADNIWFTCLTMNTNPIHFDGEYAAQTEFKKRLVNSCFTLSLVTGQSVTDLTMNGVANLGWDEVRLPHPLFEGDTVYSRSEVLETRESKSRPNVGIVRVKTTGVNQDGTPVIEFTRTFMVWKRGHVPRRSSARRQLNAATAQSARAGTPSAMRRVELQRVDRARMSPTRLDRRAATRARAAPAADSVCVAHDRNFAASSSSLAGRSG